MSTKLINFVLVFFIIVGFVLHILCSSGSIVDEIKRMKDNSDIARLLENRAIPVFGQSDDIIKDTNPDLAITWQNDNIKLWEYIETTRSKSQPYRPYKNDISDLTKIQTSLIDSIVQLHNAFYTKVRLGDNEKSDLRHKVRSLEKEIPVVIVTLEQVIQRVTNSILKNIGATRLPKNISNQVQGRQVSDIFPKIDRFISVYNKAIEDDKRHGKNYDVGRKYVMEELFSDGSVHAIEKIIEQLEKALYIEWQSKNYGRITELSSILEDIHRIYDKIGMTPTMFGMLQGTTDTLSVVLYVQALRFRGIALQLQKVLPGYLWKLK